MKIYLLIIFVFSFIFSAFGQTPAPSPAPLDDEPPIKVSTFLVNIPVIAGDRAGRNIAGLTKDNFTITQDGEKQPIEFFADENAPMNVAILIDSSYSTRSVINDIDDAAWNFVKLFRPEDQGMVATFDLDIKILTPLTAEQKKLKKAILSAGMVLRGGSNMNDAPYEIVTGEMAKIKGRKAVIVLTDGMVGGRLILKEKLLNALAESDVLVYPIIFRAKDSFASDYSFFKTFKLPNGETISEEEARRRAEEARRRQMQFMNSLGLVTGGRLFESGAKDFKKTFQIIADELKKQYLVGFYPQNMDDGKSHKIAIEVNPKEIVIRTKRRIQLKPSN